MAVVRRTRGVLLRLAGRRAAALVVGVALAAPAAWLEFSGRVDAWWADGLGLVLGATGLAFVWMGVSGRRPDWLEP
jgi:hypothetical protein